MTADELASFRALLRAQVEAPQRRPRFFAAARERPPAAVAVSQAPGGGAAADLAPTPASELLRLATAAADPPPRAPPLFGRREVDAVALEPDVRLSLAAMAEPLTLRIALAPSGPDLWEVPAVTSEAEPARPSSVAPGGWTRARPPSAQRRLLARLEAVFLAERLGLDARREAQRG